MRCRPMMRDGETTGIEAGLLVGSLRNGMEGGCGAYARSGEDNNRRKPTLLNESKAL